MITLFKDWTPDRTILLDKEGGQELYRISYNGTADQEHNRKFELFYLVGGTMFLSDHYTSEAAEYAALSNRADILAAEPTHG